MAAKKSDMAAAVASHLVKIDPQTAGWWISLAYALRRTENVEKAEAILLRAQAIHPKVAVILSTLPATRAPPVAWRTPRSACGMRSSLIRTFADWRSTMKI
jgi:predicted Zn-dependent protease